MGVGIVFGATAQNAVKTNKNAIIKPILLARAPAISVENANTKATSFSAHALRPRIVSGYSTQSALISSETSIGSSYNAFGTSDADCRALTADQDLNIVNFAHRQNNGAAGGSGLVMSSSANFSNACSAAAWDSTLMVYNEQYMSYSGGRYPSGMIYNPSGNTVVDSAFVVISGPITNGTKWIGNYFASSNYAGHHQHNFVIPEPGLLHDSAGVMFQYFAAINSQTTDDGVAHVLGERVNANAPASTTTNLLSDGVVVNNGIFDAVADTFKWSQTRIYEQFSHGNTNQEYGTSGNMAWSQDGTVGYVVFIGHDSVTQYNGTFEPIVFKTTNSGGTWTKMTVYDYSTIANITAKLPAIQSSSKVVPFFYGGAGNGIGLTVDANYNLHIACQINGVANVTNNSDSLQVYKKQQLFDVYTTSTGWNALWIDSLNAQYNTAATTPTWAGSPSTENLGNGARLQVSRTKDGKKVFYEWMDTDPNIDTLNAYPNVLAKGFDVTTNFQTPVVNFSVGTPFDASMWWMFASNITMVQTGSPNVYTIPTTRTNNASQTSTSAVQHYYMCSVSFTENDFSPLAVNELAANAMSVSQNFPNPFSKSTSFVVSLSQTSNVTIKVYNTLGQLVMETNNNNLSVGKHTMKLDAAKLSAGLYFYSVKVGDNIVTHKMIVQ